MSNYQRCYIRVYNVKEQIDKHNFVSKLRLLKKESNIFDNIYFKINDKSNYGEFRYTSRNYPTMLEEVFNLNDNDLWIINADESGSSDDLRYQTNSNNLILNFIEKAQYQFTKISFYGKTDVLFEGIVDLMGPVIKFYQKQRMEHGIDLNLKGLYTANNFYYDKEQGEIIDEIDIPKTKKFKNETAEFRDMLFHVDGIKFKELFYQLTQNAPTGTNNFPNFNKIEFYDGSILTNIIEWTMTNGMPYWKHSAQDGFHNLVNPQFYAYKLLMANQHGS